MKPILDLKIFDRQENLIHGVSSRILGNMVDVSNGEENKRAFLALLGLNIDALVLMDQVHGGKVKIVGDRDRGKVIGGVDGLVTKSADLVLGIKTADCLPVVAFEPEAKILGVVHAGHKGVLKKIGRQLILAMKKAGADPKKILVGIGPFIGSCCFEVSPFLAKTFLKAFGEIEGMIVKKKGEVFIDLLAPFTFQLVKAGVFKENIRAAKTCSACHLVDFFSYRRENESAGRFLTVAAIENLAKGGLKIIKN